MRIQLTVESDHSDMLEPKNYTFSSTNFPNITFNKGDYFRFLDFEKFFKKGEIYDLTNDPIESFGDIEDLYGHIDFPIIGLHHCFCETNNEYVLLMTLKLY